MFIIENTYLASQEKIDSFIPAHRAYMDVLFKEGLFIAMGPKVPRDGGVIISAMHNKDELIKLLNQEPLVKNDLVSYRLIEFKPTVVGDKFSFLMGV
ncbi:hypothetical protein AWY96_01380 [Serratia plymuthica]|uniref:YciI family protein n=1 Tax=Serratia plymuthica TaxID=82996 RepID=UPI0007A0DB12|nr:YciI family protein [Serratia plymuthica]KYQ97222.1 hypothetical protein AWY96_01380 [Serratia plymuthica]